MIFLRLVENMKKEGKELILIPCSGSKNPGGEEKLQGRSLAEELEDTFRKGLLGLRQKVAHLLDIEFKDGQPASHQKLMLAYRRYSGNIYGRITPTAWERLRSEEDVELVIVSALYGPIYWDEPIVYYDVAMNSDVGLGMKLNSWWRNHGLEDILANYINRKGYLIVRSLLSGNYRKALPRLETRVAAECLQYEYRSLGSGSDYYRGRDVVNILSERGVVCPECGSRRTRRVSRSEGKCASCGKIYRL